MGIKGLSDFLKKNYPNIFEHIHVSEFAYKKIAIDTSVYLCSYKVLYGDEGWISAFIKMITVLRSNKIHCIFVFDNISPPEKQVEKNERKENREKMDRRVTELELAIEQYEKTGEISPCLVEFQKKKNINQNLLLTSKGVNINLNMIQYYVKKMRKNLFTLHQEDFQTIKDLFTIFNIPYITAEQEAETLCADFCKQGKVDAVLSEDTDLLAYFNPISLTKFNTKNETFIRINLDNLLESLKMDRENFLDFCIMCGCDYNKNIPKIGPVKAYKYIIDFKNIENVKDNVDVDISVLNHVRTRELFKNHPVSNFEIPYCGTPDFDLLRKFVAEKYLRVNVDDIIDGFKKNLLVIEEDDDTKTD
jgi:flap endonuclease-1